MGSILQSIVLTCPILSSTNCGNKEAQVQWVAADTISAGSPADLATKPCLSSRSLSEGPYENTIAASSLIFCRLSRGAALQFRAMADSKVYIPQLSTGNPSEVQYTKFVPRKTSGGFGREGI